MRAIEFLVESMSRRNFMKGAAAAGAMAATGANAMQYKPQPEEYNVLSPNTDNELVLQKVARHSGLKGSELAQFLGQMKHESWDFSKMSEKPKFKDYFAHKYDIRYAPKTARMLGNNKPGDGERYHGRGYVQLTGRDNYRMAGEAIGVDLVNHPELAAKPDVAAKIALWYWKTRVKPNVQNFGDTTSVTKAINPALLGLQARHQNFKDYLRIL